MSSKIPKRKGLKRNYTYLLTANIIASLIGIISLVITTHVLTVTNFGLLMLIQVYVMIVGQFVSFKTWQPVIKYGIDLLNESDLAGFTSLIQTAFKIDIVTAFIGFLLALGLAWPVFTVMDWDKGSFDILLIYCLTILLNFSGPGMGILRIFDRFDLIAMQQILFQSVRCVCLVFCWKANLGLNAIIYSWVIPEILAYFFLMSLGFYELRRQKIKLLIPVPIFSKQKEFFSFIIANNFDSSIRAVSRNIDVLLIGFFAGQAQAGIYKLAIQLSGVITRFTDPIYQLLLPVFTELVSKGKKRELKEKMKKITLLSTSIFFAIYIIILLVGHPFISFVFEPEYSSVYKIMCIYLIALGMATSCLTIVPFMHAMGLPKVCLKVQSKSTILYCIVLLPLAYYLGTTGAAVAYILYHIFWFKLIWPRVIENLE